MRWPGRGSKVLAALAFTIGFIALTLARGELFTEDFLVPVTAIIADRARPRELARLWVGTGVMNLVGGWLVIALFVTPAGQRSADPHSALAARVGVP